MSCSTPKLQAIRVRAGAHRGPPSPCPVPPPRPLTPDGRLWARAPPARWTGWRLTRPSTRGPFRNHKGPPSPPCALIPASARLGALGLTTSQSQKRSPVSGSLPTSSLPAGLAHQQVPPPNTAFLSRRPGLPSDEGPAPWPRGPSPLCPPRTHTRP